MMVLKFMWMMNENRKNYRRVKINRSSRMSRKNNKCLRSYASCVSTQNAHSIVNHSVKELSIQSVGKRSNNKIYQTMMTWQEN